MDLKEGVLQYLSTPSGKLTGVVLSIEGWEAIKNEAEPRLQRVFGKVSEKPEPMQDWEMFKDYWDYKYPFCARVECAQCGASTENWEEDDPRKFRLKAANIGGLVAFECSECKSRVIKRHFKDAIKFECVKSSSCA